MAQNQNGPTAEAAGPSITARKHTRNPFVARQIERLRAEIVSEAGNHTRANGYAILAWAHAQQVHGPAKKVLTTLAFHADARGYCWIRSRKLATECGLTNRRQVFRHLRTLQLAGLIAAVEQRDNRNARIENGYWVAFWRGTPVTSTSQGVVPRDASVTGPVTSTSQGVRRPRHGGGDADVTGPVTPESPLRTTKRTAQGTAPELPDERLSSAKETADEEVQSPPPAAASAGEATASSTGSPANSPEAPVTSTSQGAQVISITAARIVEAVRAADPRWRDDIDGFRAEGVPDDELAEWLTDQAQKYAEDEAFNARMRKLDKDERQHSSVLPTHIVQAVRAVRQKGAAA